MALRLDRSLAARLAAPMRVALVSGTNGKTTTTTLLAAGLATAAPTATNRTGANLPNGLTFALMTTPDATFAALEVDEGYVPWALRELAPTAVALLNLSRDQLDRLNEVRGTADRWRAALAERRPALVVANADDPLVVWAAGDDTSTSSGVVWVSAGLAWQLDASACPWCESDLVFDDDSWRCDACGRTRPERTLALVDGQLVRVDGSRVALDLALPGRSAMANAAMAFAVIEGLGVRSSPRWPRGAASAASRGATSTWRTKARSSCCTWPRTRRDGPTSSTSSPPARGR